MKQECNLYASFFVACKNRGCDHHDVFIHENDIYPPSILEYGKLKLPNNKSEILNILENLHQNSYT